MNLSRWEERENNIDLMRGFGGIIAVSGGRGSLFVTTFYSSDCGSYTKAKTA